jgi:hypothetical protein
MNPQPPIHGVGPGGRILIATEVQNAILSGIAEDVRNFRDSLAYTLARKDALLPEQRDGLATFLRELAAETADAITALGGHRFCDAVTPPAVEQGIAEAMPSKGKNDPAEEQFPGRLIGGPSAQHTCDLPLPPAIAEALDKPKVAASRPASSTRGSTKGRRTSRPSAKPRGGWMRAPRSPAS